MKHPNRRHTDRMDFRFAAAIAVAITFFALLWMDCASANDKVKYCRDATTGKIYTVQKGMPCPGTTHEL